jgi:CDP-glucose 4,6-dehydratase
MHQNRQAFWQERRVLVTGATGIVGSWLAKRLVESGAYVVAFIQDHNPQSELIRTALVRRLNVVDGQLEDFATIERAINLHEIDTVFHLGAQTIVGVANRNPLPTFEANIRGTYNLLEACRVHRSLVSRIILASSDKAYGDHQHLPYTEATPLEGKHPYDVSKSCADLICQAYFHTFALPVAIARCGNVYGGGDLNWSRIVPGTIRSLFLGQRPQLRSDGKCLRDYIFVGDAVSAYLRLAEELERPDVRGGAFNFSVGTPVDVMTIVGRIRRLMGREDLEPIVQNCAVGEIRDQYLSGEKAQKLLGWRPQFELDQGLRETIDWYRDFLGDSR